jgi:hypothetical protein
MPIKTNNKLMKNIFSFLFVVFGFTSVFSQNAPTLGYSKYIEYVTNYHPLLNQAYNRAQFGRANQQMARGAFDLNSVLKTNKKNTMTNCITTNQEEVFLYLHGLAFL